MRKYKEELVKKLNEPGQRILVNGVKVEVKPVPDGDGTAKLDPRLYQRELAMRSQTKKAADSPEEMTEESIEPPYEEMRKQMGGFNYNLNTKEIYTKYVEVKTNVGVVPVWIHYPRHMQDKRPALLYVHGGAFFGGTPFTLENHCRLIAERADCVTFNIDYSLAPEHPYPIPCTQVYEVLCYVHQHAEAFQVDAGKILIAGDSAGGNLAAVCAQMDRDKGTNYLKAQILIYPKLTFSNYLLEGYHRDENAFEIIEE